MKSITKVLAGEGPDAIAAAVEALKLDYARAGGLQMVEVAGGYQIVTRPDLHEWVRRLFHERTTQKLSVAALETLAVIAYKQPITAAEITEVRGVNTSGVLGTLIDRKLVKITGPEAGGRPAVHVRDHAGVPQPLRPARPERPAEGRGHGRRARVRAAAAGGRGDDGRAAVRRADAAAGWPRTTEGRGPTDESNGTGSR